MQKRTNTLKKKKKKKRKEATDDFKSCTFERVLLTLGSQLLVVRDAAVVFKLKSQHEDVYVSLRTVHGGAKTNDVQVSY